MHCKVLKIFFGKNVLKSLNKTIENQELVMFKVDCRSCHILLIQIKFHRLIFGKDVYCAHILDEAECVLR